MSLAAPTAGHHFSAWLTCPQQAWYAYHGQKEHRAPDPPYLQSLQQEGHDHEAAMVARHYPEAVVVPDRRLAPEKMALTLAAMKSGVPAILQGHLRWADAVGVMDVLEHVREEPASPLGHIYRVGEIKRSMTLKTAHVMQAAWYTELLERVQGVSLEEAAFILGDGDRRLVPLGPVRAAYARVRADLLPLRTGSEPGPALCVACSSCPWRRLCMPRLVDDAHLTLIPGIGRRRAALLNGAGFHHWSDLPSNPASILASIGLAQPEIQRAVESVDALLAGRAVLKHELHPEQLSSLVPATVEFTESPGGHPQPAPQPIALWVHRGGKTTSIPIDTGEGGVGSADLSALGARTRLGLYGGTDFNAMRGIARHGAPRQMELIDLLEVFEKLVHAPVAGLGLDTVEAFVADRAEPLQLRSPAERVIAISRVLSWLAGASRLAA